MSIILHTSGSTDKPKQITHSWEYINNCAKRTIKEIKLTNKDIVLDVFPANTIAHWTISAYPSALSGAQLVTAKFNAFTYLELFEQIRPTVISLIPKHLELLSKSKKWNHIDMSCVRYMVTGSNKIEQSFIDAFKDRGVQLVANWYGMTEFPPPVLIGYNSTSFTNISTDDKIIFKPLASNKNLAEAVINNYPTGDIFNMKDMTFYSRMKESNGKTWKTDF